MKTNAPLIINPLLREYVRSKIIITNTGESAHVACKCCGVQWHDRWSDIRIDFVRRIVIHMENHMHDTMDAAAKRNQLHA